MKSVWISAIVCLSFVTNAVSPPAIAADFGINLRPKNSSNSSSDCPYCLDQVRPGQEKVIFCEDCAARSHEECIKEQIDHTCPSCSSPMGYLFQRRGTRPELIEESRALTQDELHSYVRKLQNIAFTIHNFKKSDDSNSKKQIKRLQFRARKIIKRLTRQIEEAPVGARYSTIILSVSVVVAAYITVSIVASVGLTTALSKLLDHSADYAWLMHVVAGITPLAISMIPFKGSSLSGLTEKLIVKLEFAIRATLDGKADWNRITEIGAEQALIESAGNDVMSELRERSIPFDPESLIDSLSILAKEGLNPGACNTVIEDGNPIPELDQKPPLDYREKTH